MATQIESSVQAFTAVAANGQSTVYVWPGGVGQFSAAGTWDGATCKLQMSPDAGTTWIDVGSDVSKTADGIGNFELGPCQVRVDLSSVGTTSINSWIAIGAAGA